MTTSTQGDEANKTTTVGRENTRLSGTQTLVSEGVKNTTQVNEARNTKRVGEFDARRKKARRVQWHDQPAADVSTGDEPCLGETEGIDQLACDNLGGRVSSVGLIPHTPPEREELNEQLEQTFLPAPKGRGDTSVGGRTGEDMRPLTGGDNVDKEYGPLARETFPDEPSLLVPVSGDTVE